MGTLTRSQLVNEISSFFGDRTDLTEDRYITWLNLAQDRMVRMANFTELERVSYDTTAYTGNKDYDKFMAMPINTRKVLNVRLIDGTHSRALKGYPYREFDKTVPYPQRFDTGRPSIFTYWNNNIEFWKVPDAEYRIEVRRIIWPTDFNSTDDNTSDLDHKDDALIMLAVSWGFASLRNMEDSSRYWAIFRNMMENIIGEDREQPYVDMDSLSPNAGINVEGNYWANPFVKGVDNGLE